MILKGQILPALRRGVWAAAIAVAAIVAAPGEAAADGSIAGSVTREANGAPAAMVCVSAVSATTLEFEMAQTDAGGQYSIREPGRGRRLHRPLRCLRLGQPAQRVLRRPARFRLGGSGRGGRRCDRLRCQRRTRAGRPDHRNGQRAGGRAARRRLRPGRGPVGGGIGRDRCRRRLRDPGVADR